MDELFARSQSRGRVGGVGNATFSYERQWWFQSVTPRTIYIIVLFMVTYVLRSAVM